MRLGLEDLTRFLFSCRILLRQEHCYRLFLSSVETTGQWLETTWYEVKPLALCIQILTVGLGVVVLAGWHLGLRSLVQVFPGLVPMQYNTALGFLLLGLSFIAVQVKHWRGVGGLSGGV